MSSFVSRRLGVRAIVILLGASLLWIVFGLRNSAGGVVFAQKQNSSIFQAPGASIYFEVMGGGHETPLMVINGGPGFDHTYMRSQAWVILGQKRPVVFYDQRGTGRSGPYKPEQSYTFDDQISDLEALRVHLGYERADFVGHSWDGFLAMGYSAMYPQHVSHLILVDSVPAKWDDIKPIYEQVFPEFVARLAQLNEQAQNGDAKHAEKRYPSL